MKTKKKIRVVIYDSLITLNKSYSKNILLKANTNKGSCHMANYFELIRIFKVLTVYGFDTHSKAFITKSRYETIT